MASLVSLVSSVLENLENLRIDPSRCVKARSPLSKCSACFDICPVGGVQWTGRNVEINECINCGLCAAVCPSGGIVHKDSAPHDVLGRVEKLLSSFEEAYVCCSKHVSKSPVEQGIEIPCLGLLNWESWLGLVMNHRVKVYHSFESCETCSFKGGKELFHDELAKAEILCGKKIPFFSQLATSVNKSEEPAINNERREFLGSIFKSFIKIPEKVFSNVTGLELEKLRESEQNNLSDLPDDEKLNANYKLLLDSINLNPDLEERIKIEVPHIKENCQYCGVCSTLCPQQALNQQNGNKKYQIKLNKSRCTGCRLCEDICFHKAIELMSSSVVTLEKATNVLAEGSEFICSNCGIPYRATYEDKCPNCKKAFN